MGNKKQGFTLAEVLITLAIIGIVAAINIPPLVVKNQKRAWDTASSTFERKLGEALRVMNTRSELKGYNSTQEFLSALGKHMKISKICDSNKLTDCFANEISFDNEILQTDKYTKSINLNNRIVGTETLGVQFANGVTALIAYNKNCTENPYDNNVVQMGVIYQSSPDDEYSEYAEYGDFKSRKVFVKLSTDAIAILYDVTGTKKPNQYSDTKDIRGINLLLSDGSIANIGLNYKALDCSSSNSTSDDYKKYCGSPSGHSNDYFAGAQKACAEIGLKVPTLEELMDLNNKRGTNGIPTYGCYGSTHEIGNNASTGFEFGSGYCSNYKYRQFNIVCTK